MARENYLSVTVRTEIEESEPEGDPCVNCGDLIFLKAFRLVVLSKQTVIGRSCGQFCQGCGEIIRDTLNGKNDHESL